MLEDTVECNIRVQCQPNASIDSRATVKAAACTAGTTWRTRGQSHVVSARQVAPLAGTRKAGKGLPIRAPEVSLPLFFTTSYCALLCCLFPPASVATGSSPHVSATLPALPHNRIPRLAPSAITCLLPALYLGPPHPIHAESVQPRQHTSLLQRCPASTTIIFPGSRVLASRANIIYTQYARSAATGPRERQDGLAQGPLPRRLWRKLQIKLDAELPRTIAGKFP